MWILWAPLGIGLTIVYMVIYTLLRTSGDGRSVRARLLHPNRVGRQEEYGGTGPGRTGHSGRPES